MKNRIYILMTLVAMLGTTTSCDDFLDITPEGQVERDDLLSNSTGIEDALYGAYSQLRNTSLYGKTLFFSHLELMAQTLYCNDTPSLKALSQYDYAYSDIKDDFEAVWTLMYKNISNVNSVINCDLVKNAGPNDYPYNIYKGEALGLRAFMHFDLMRIFCEQITVNPNAEGIPYATEFSLNTPNFESLAKNYEHVVADLLEAEKLLADEDKYQNSSVFMNDRQIHFNLYAVRATLARVYLTKGEKDKAYEYAKNVINKSPFTLTTKEKLKGDVAGVLSNTETIFGVYYPNLYNSVKANLETPSSKLWLIPRIDIETIYRGQDAIGADMRFSAYFTQENKEGNVVETRMSKFTDTYESTGISRPKGLTPGVTLIRLPEMYYICAEVSVLNNDIADAQIYFDAMIQHRFDKPVIPTVTLDKINLERDKEFVGEGQIFFNNKRLNQSIKSVDGTKEYQPSKDIYVVPVPDVEYENRY